MENTSAGPLGSLADLLGAQVAALRLLISILLGEFLKPDLKKLFL